MDVGGLQHLRVRTHGIHLHCAVAGDGPLVVLLHGFPEGWRSWQRQIPALARRFKVVVPDLRGHGESDAPKKGYDLGSLADDVRGLIEHFAGRASARIVGHDWGALLTWVMAYRHPGRVDRLATLNGPHPAIFADHILRGPQLARTAHFLGYQIPILPEVALGALSAFGVQRYLLRNTAQRAAWTPEDLRDARRAAADSATVRAGLTMVRTVLRKGPKQVRPWSVPLEVPSLVIWGEQDPIYGRELLDDLPHYAENLRVERIPEAGHFVQREAPDRVNQALLSFFEGSRPAF